MATRQGRLVVTGAVYVRLFMTARLALLPAAALVCLGFSGAGAEPLPAFFADDFEEKEVAGRGLGQSYYEGILITGTPGYMTQVKQALGKIEAVDSRNWYFVRKHIRRITETGHIGMDVAGGRFTSRLAGAADAEDLGGQLVHDAWHRELFMTDRPWSGREAELFCMGHQNEFLARANRPLVDVKAALLSEYWTVDYWSRDW